MSEGLVQVGNLGTIPTLNGSVQVGNWTAAAPAPPATPPAFVQMAGQKSTTGNTTPTTVTISLTTGNGALVFSLIQNGNAVPTSITNVTDSAGNVYNLILGPFNHVNNAGNDRMVVYFCPVVSGSPTFVRVTQSGDKFNNVVVVEVSHATGSDTGASTGIASNTTWDAGNISTVSAQTLLVAFCAYDDGIGSALLTQGAAWTSGGSFADTTICGARTMVQWQYVATAAAIDQICSVASAKIGNILTIPVK